MGKQIFIISPSCHNCVNFKDGYCNKTKIEIPNEFNTYCNLHEREVLISFLEPSHAYYDYIVAEQNTDYSEWEV